MSVDVLGFSKVCQKKIRVPLVCRAHELSIASCFCHACMHACRGKHATKNTSFLVSSGVLGNPAATEITTAVINKASI